MLKLNNYETKAARRAVLVLTLPFVIAWALARGFGEVLRAELGNFPADFRSLWDL